MNDQNQFSSVLGNKRPFETKEETKKSLELPENKHFISRGIFVIVKNEYLMSMKEVRRD
jgi:hypothetical protein